MIFNEDFDTSLWLLVAGNRKDSNMISNLISYIPEDVYKSIQEAINDYYSKDRKFIGDIVFSTNIHNEDDFDYYITVKIRNNKIYFNVLRWIENNQRIEEEYELSLVKLSYDDLFKMLCGDRKIIGKYGHEIFNISYNGNLSDISTDNYSRKYSVSRGLFGYVVDGMIKRIPCSRKYVNVLKNIPDELFVDDFSSFDKVNGLVKKKKRVRK